MVNSVSLCNNANVSFAGKSRINSDNEKSLVENPNQSDSFKSSKSQNKKSNSSPLWQKITAYVVTFFLGAGAATMAKTPAKIEDLPSVLCGQCLQDIDLDELAASNNSHPDIILSYNGVDSVEELRRKGDFEVPPLFTGLDANLERINKTLASDDLTPRQRMFAEKEKANIIEFQNRQKEYAVAYKKDGCVFVILQKDCDENTIRRIFGVDVDYEVDGIIHEAPEVIVIKGSKQSSDPDVYTNGTVLGFNEEDVNLDVQYRLLNEWDLFEFNRVSGLNK